MNKESIYIVAELSANHGGSLEHAVEKIRAAVKVGVGGCLSDKNGGVVDEFCEKNLFK